MIKVFTENTDKKIELTKKELEKLLADSYNEGYYKALAEKQSYIMPYYCPFLNYSNGMTTSNQSQE